MAHRYVAELTDGMSDRYCFSYVDTDDNLAALLFNHLKLDVETDMIFQIKDDPYRIVTVKIPREQRETFLHAVDLLPAFMDYAGWTDYEAYCRAFFLNAHRWLAKKEAAGGTARLQ